MRGTVDQLARDVHFDAFGHDLLMSVFRAESQSEIVCLHLGDLASAPPLPVRLHSSCLPAEAFGSQRCDCAWQLQYAVDFIAAAGRGAVLYLPHHDGRGAGVSVLLRSYELMDRGMSSAEAFAALSHPADQRDYSGATAVLRFLGVRQVLLLTNSPQKIAALRSAGIGVRKRLPIVMPDRNGHVLRSMRSKVSDFGHVIDGAVG